MNALYDFDEAVRKISDGRVAGVDEAGRGPLAGPVVAAAVIFYKSVCLEGLNDSKQVKPGKRKDLFWEIAKHGLVGIGVVDEKAVDAMNIFQATRLAMRQAVNALSSTPSLLLVDGPIQLDIPIPQRKVIAGDRKSASIAAASIIAKVYRDAVMDYYDTIYPDYLFRENKGYPTRFHLRALTACGPSPIHRRSFGPVNTAIQAAGK